MVSPDIGSNDYIRELVSHDQIEEEVQSWSCSEHKIPETKGMY